MKVRVFMDGPLEMDGCVYYRMHLPGSTLQAAGYDVTTHRGVTDVIWQDDVKLHPDGRILKDPRVKGWQDPDCDVAVFQRPLHRDTADLIEWCRDNGVRTVVDMDDDYLKIPQENKAWQHAQPHLNPIRNTDHLKRAIRACDLVTVTTPALARRYAPRKTVVLSNYVPASFLDRPERPLPSRVTVGWTGTLHTHPHDLESTKGAIGRAVSASGAQMHVVGDGEGVEEALAVPEGSVTKTGWVPLPHYPDKMNEIDVGVVPLATSAFNQGKSWLKGLEFSALGIPFVSSNTQAYVQLANEHGLGVVARNPAEWERHVFRLATQDGYREDAGQRAREYVREHMTIEQHAVAWWDAWASVLDRQPVVA
jgi:glycosyltransferase involved in cell wall biosynthesis